MNCEQMNELLSVWLDGELTPEEQADMQAHLDQCPACRALLEQLQALHTSFENMEELATPEGFAQGVMSRIAQEEAKPTVIPFPKRTQVRRLAALAACAALCIGFGGVALKGGFRSASAETTAAAPEAASYAMDAETAESIAGAMGKTEASIEEPAEAEREGGVNMENAAAEEPTAPALTVQPAQGTAVPEGALLDGAEAKAYSGGQIILTQLPEGLEETLGRLAWEERAADGAQCARLTQEQAELLLELADAQGLATEVDIPDAGAEENWTLVYLEQ